MALLLIEGFDAYSTVTDAYYPGAVAGFTIETTITNSGRASLHLNASNTLSMAIPFGGTSNEIYFGFAFYFTSLPSSLSQLVTMCGDHYEYFDLMIDTDGTLSFRSYITARSPDSGVNVLAVDTWYYIEVKVVKSNSISAGDVSLRVDGVEWIELDAASDTLYSLEPAYTNSLLFWPQTGKDLYFDDIYICDETGAKNNTFLGPVKVATIYPNGNGNSSQFTGSDADSVDNYLHVDDATGQDDDSSYVESDTINHVDLYTLEDLPGTTGTIHGVDFVSVVKNDVEGGGNSRQGAPVVRVNGTDYQGDTFNVGSPFTHKHHILEDNPDDAADWERADIDATEFGIKVIA